VLVEPRAGTSQPEHPARARTWRSLAATLRLPCTPGGSVGTGHAGGRRREGIGTPPPGVAAERVSARHAMSSRTAATHSRRSAQREGTASAASPLQVARAVPQPRVGTRRDPTTSELRGGPQLGATDERLAVLVVRLAAARLASPRLDHVADCQIQDKVGIDLEERLAVPRRARRRSRSRGSRAPRFRPGLGTRGEAVTSVARGRRSRLPRQSRTEVRQERDASAASATTSTTSSTTWWLARARTTSSASMWCTTTAGPRSRSSMGSGV
jgi:hypothetical protein